MAHTGIYMDLTHFPLVVKRVGNAFDLADMQAYLKDMDALHARKEPFVAVILVKEKGPLDRRVFGEYGRWVKQNEALMKQFYTGAAFVFPGEVFRFVLSAILLAAPAPVPHAVFATADDACKWALDKLRAAGGRPPRLTGRDLEQP